MKENNSQKTRPAIRMEEKDAFACNNFQTLRDSSDPLFAGKGIVSGCRGINTRKLGNTKAGGDQVEQSTTVVVNNVIYDVTRVFSGKRKAKDLLKCQILTDAASTLRSLPPQCYNGVSGLAMEKEVL